MQRLVRRPTGNRFDAGPSTLGRSLPPDLLDQALRRLSWVAGALSVAMLASLLAHALAVRADLGWPLPPLAIAARAVGALAGALVVWMVRNPRIERARKVQLGVAFEVVAAAAIALTEVALMPAFGLPLGVISAVALWILLYQLIVPTPSLQALIGASLSAATVPLALRLSELVGGVAVDPMVAFGLLKTSFGTALVAWIASRGVYHLGAAVSAARKLGSYELQERIGGGGMGEVWRARHALLKRPAAIKLIRPDTDAGVVGSTPDVLRERFEREAQATASLQSPHTVTVYDYGCTDDGAFYYVMELLDGLDLETLVERHGPVPAERCAHFLRQACRSLAEAHDRGMVHRDIKPANLFACRLGPELDYLKVLDFGVVKLGELFEPGDGTLTLDGAAVGTPAFMAPEVAMGSTNIDASADIYALGCVGYWLLTGSLVFEGQTPVRVLSQHIYDLPEPVSQRTELDVPPALEATIMACLQKEPQHRPQSARELLQRLDACDAELNWSEKRADRWWRSHHRNGHGQNAA